MNLLKIMEFETVKSTMTTTMMSTMVMYSLTYGGAD